MSEDRNWIENFGVRSEDPGYIYIVENSGRYKIGRSKTPELRMKAAKTWLPDMNLVGIKPFWNIREIERNLHEGFAACWYAGEWFDPIDDDYRDLLVEGFTEFSDTDPDSNSVDFIYWFNSGGMSEFVIERYAQGLTLPKFLEQESDTRKS